MRKRMGIRVNLNQKQVFNELGVAQFNQALVHAVEGGLLSALSSC